MTSVTYENLMSSV